METILEFFHHLRHLNELISWGGLAVLVAIVFAETGLLVGFVLPGDSLLVTAGLFAARGDLRIGELILSLTAATILGDNMGYWIGSKSGPHLFARPDSRLFKREYLLRTQAFYEKHGGKTIAIARFIPIIRTFAPVVAGIAGMPYRRFLAYDICGGIAWVFSLCLTGYFLGNLIPGIDKHIERVIMVVVALSVLPLVIHAYKERAHGRASGPLLRDER